MTSMPAAVSIASNINTSQTGTITFDELSAYFALVNMQYERESDGTKEASGILRNLNPNADSPSCTVAQFASYLSTTFSKYPEKLERLNPLSEQVKAAWTEAQTKMVGKMVGGPATATPPWERGLMERPAGEKDMGGWTRGVFTPEQQARLSVDENGTKVEKLMQALPPAHLTGSMEAPAGTRDMGTYSRGVYTPEQQARLSVDEDGKKSPTKFKHCHLHI